MENRALGKGLSALIPDKPRDDQSRARGARQVTIVPTAKVRPNSLQPRRHYDAHKLAELKESIREKGILQPVLVRENNGEYEVVAGERRFRAAQSLGLEEIPVIVKELSNAEALVIALIENIQREELNPIEEAAAFKRLIEEFHLKQDEVAQSVGKDRSTISNTMRLLKLPDEIQQGVISGAVTMGHARSLLAIENPVKQKALFEEIIAKGLSVREVENIVSGQSPSSGRKGKKTAGRHHEMVFLEDDLQQVLGTKVRIHAGKKRGKIVIEYYSPDDLERILQIIKS